MLHDILIIFQFQIFFFFTIKGKNYSQFVLTYFISFPVTIKLYSICNSQPKPNQIRNDLLHKSTINPFHTTFPHQLFLLFLLFLFSQKEKKRKTTILYNYSFASYWSKLIKLHLIESNQTELIWIRNWIVEMCFNAIFAKP